MKLSSRLPKAYSLVIGQNHQAANSEVVGFHLCVDYGNESNGFLVVEGGIASHSSTELSIQIMILPKTLPHGVVAPLHLELNCWVGSFF